MQEILFAWVGNADLAAAENQRKDLGPIAQAATDRKFDLVMCLNSHAIKTQTAYMAWLQRIAAVEVGVHHVKLSSPTNFAEIFVAARCRDVGA